MLNFVLFKLINEKFSYGQPEQSDVIAGQKAKVFLVYHNFLHIYYVFCSIYFWLAINDRILCIPFFQIKSNQ